MGAAYSPLLCVKGDSCFFKSDTSLTAVNLCATTVLVGRITTAWATGSLEIGVNSEDNRATFDAQ